MSKRRRTKVQQPPRSKPPRKTPTSSKRQPSHLELSFFDLWEQIAAGSPFVPLLKEVTLPPRRFRYDFRIPNTNVLVEVQGGTRVANYGHSSHEGIKRDCEKSRYAQMKDWQVFAYTADQITQKELEELFVYVCRKFWISKP